MSEEKNKKETEIVVSKPVKINPKTIRIGLPPQPAPSPPTVDDDLQRTLVSTNLSLSDSSNPASDLKVDGDSRATAPAARQNDAEVIAGLAAMSPLEYDRIRIEQAKLLGCRTAVLDKAVTAARNEPDETNSLPFPEVEQHPEPIYPAQLLDEIVVVIRRYIVLDVQLAIAAALWVALTWFADVVSIATLAIINAPEKACAKTLFQTLLAHMAYRPLSAANATTSVLFRSAELWKPTIFIDEADTFFRANPELNGMVNAGYHREGFVLRSEAVGDSFIPRKYSVYCPKSIAGISLEKHLTDATMSRGIVFNLRRKLPHETVERFRHADKEIFADISSKLARFAADYSLQVRQARPTLPEA